MKRVLRTALVAGALAGSVLTAGAARSQAYVPPVHNLPPEAQEHVDLAYLIADGVVGENWLNAQLHTINPPGGPGWADPMALRQAHKVTIPPTKAFDQLYYLGMNTVASWALVTSQGIILIDSLDNPGEARDIIEGGLRKAGLDPARIKYIIVTHGHSDHYGGAKYLADKFHARVMMSAIDWDFAATTARNDPNFGPVPTHDMDIADGSSLTLGATTIHFYITPGHTPGAASLIFNVTDHGRPHVVSFLGGGGLQTIDRDVSKGGYEVMRQSLLRFARLSGDAGADVLMTNHPFMDNSVENAAKRQADKGAGPSPWVVGKAATLRYYAAYTEIVYALEANYRAKPATGRYVRDGAGG